MAQLPRAEFRGNQEAHEAFRGRRATPRFAQYLEAARHRQSGHALSGYRHSASLKPAMSTKGASREASAKVCFLMERQVGIGSAAAALEPYLKPKPEVTW